MYEMKVFDEEATVERDELLLDQLQAYAQMGYSLEETRTLMALRGEVQ